MILPDTNVLVAYFKKKEPTQSLLENYISKHQIIFSVVSVAEFLIRAFPAEAEIMRSFIEEFGVIPIDQEIMRQAVVFRQQTIQKTKRSHLLDCFIAATAKVHKATLLTFDRRDYPFPDLSIKQPEESKI